MKWNDKGIRLPDRGRDDANQCVVPTPIGGILLDVCLIPNTVLYVHLVLDTNVLVAALRSKQGASNKLLRIIASGRASIAVSVALVLEYEDVLQRPHQVPGFPPGDVSRFIDAICAVATHQEIFYTWRPRIPDPDDEIVLELAVASGASHIVTHNLRHFKIAKKFGIRVVSPSELLKEI